MARYGKQSKRGAAQILDTARAFFGEGGLGLQVLEQDERSIHFVGGGGHVRIEIDATAKGSEVTLETREWDRQVQEFLGKF